MDRDECTTGCDGKLMAAEDGTLLIHVPTEIVFVAETAQQPELELPAPPPTSAFSAGYEACRRGEPRTANKHLPRSFLWNQWKDGWYACRGTQLKLKVQQQEAVSG